MCGKNRESQGGAIAILKSLDPRESNKSTSAELRFQVDANAQARRVTYNGYSMDSFYLVIHKQGDMTRPIEEAGFFRKIHFQPTSTEQSQILAMKLHTPLEISPCGEGVIGRRISLYDGQMRERLAEGIIGWN